MEEEEPDSKHEALLPPNWESARDINEKIYFYNRTLGVVQWDPPDIAQDNTEEARDAAAAETMSVAFVLNA